ncbi:MAG: general secretion pathway protein GspB [Syntrophobacteraceae bacterium]|nr:general secretion pathway protein GspB [Syntrophobacteraceae bacterium]
MSYILDALKKSEKARGGRKAPELAEEPPHSPALHLPTSKNSRRILYLLAFILCLNAAVFVLLTRPRRAGAPAISHEPAKANPGMKTASALPPAKKKSPPTSLVPAPDQQAISPKHKALSLSSGGPTARPKGAVPSPPSHHRESALAARGHSRAEGGIVRKNGPAKDLSVKEKVSRPQPLSHGLPPGRLAAAKKARPLDRHPAGQAAIDSKAEDLKALLEKQAESLEKSERPARRREKFLPGRDLARTNTANEPEAPRLSGLPAPIREALPNLSVSMLVYSKRTADRFIYINGVKRHEGDEISSGLKLERITHDGAIFTYLGRRFYKSVLGD